MKFQRILAAVWVTTLMCRFCVGLQSANFERKYVVRILNGLHELRSEIRQEEDFVQDNMYTKDFILLDHKHNNWGYRITLNREFTFYHNDTLRNKYRYFSGKFTHRNNQTFYYVSDNNNAGSAENHTAKIELKCGSVHKPTHIGLSDGEFEYEATFESPYACFSPCIELGVNYVAVDSKRIENVTFWQDCQSLCQRHSNCEMFTFNTDGMCYLTGSAGYTVFLSDGSVSGPAACPTVTQCPRLDTDYVGADVTTLTADSWSLCQSLC
eukprot:801461_1